MDNNNIDKKEEKFCILEKEDNEENEDDENYGFHDLSFKEIYMTNNLFSHVITHLNSFLSKNKNSNEKIVINTENK